MRVTSDFWVRSCWRAASNIFRIKSVMPKQRTAKRVSCTGQNEINGSIDLGESGKAQQADCHEASGDKGYGAALERLRYICALESATQCGEADNE